MSVIDDLRKELKHRLDKLEGQAEALEAQFDESSEQVLERIEKQKELLKRSAGRLEEIVGDSAAIAVDTAHGLRPRVDHLRVQLALGRAETRDVLKEQERKIHTAIDGVEEWLSGAEDHLEEDLAKETAAFVRIANRLRAELEAAELQYALFRADHRDDFVAGKKALREKLRELRRNFSETSHEAGERFEDFESEFGEGLAHIRQAFLDLRKKN